MTTTPTHAARPHVLYVSWGFPPMSGGGAYRTMSTANVLTEAGFDVTVLTADRGAYVGMTGIDNTLELGIDPRIKVTRVTFTDPQIEHNLRAWPKKRAKRPDKWFAGFRASVSFPEPRFGQWMPALLEAAEEVYRRRPVDLVIGSANPHVDLAVGPHLHRMHGVPYVVDHRDSWRLNWYTGTEAHLDDPRVAATESAIVRDAHEVWFVNEAIADWHRTLYPAAADRIRVVSNGFDARFAPTPRTEAREHDGPLVFTYVGALSPVVPVAEFLEGWVEARRRDPGMADAVAHIYGPLRTGDRTTARLLAAGAPYGVEFHGPAPKDELAGIYESSDVLLLLLAGGRFVTSGKVYEYASSGLPIVSVHEPDNGAGDVLRGYPLWEANKGLAPDQVATALIRSAALARGATDNQRQQAVDFSQHLERHAQLRVPIDDLRKFVEKKGVTQ